MTDRLKRVAETYISLGKAEGVTSITTVVVDFGNLEKIMHRKDFSMGAHTHNFVVKNHGTRMTIDGVDITMERLESPEIMTLNEAMTKRGEILGL
ncbi:hypothetical protein HY440_03240 [Candidatus Microgenomates bacterium]|nr:hypothetical protein [Candidatus Microgenomates bacterium]